MTTVATLGGFFKKRYGELSEVVPEHAIMHEKIPFSKRGASKLGSSYDFPVRLRRAMGWTFSAAGEAFTLNSAIAGKMVNATVGGASFVLREQVSYDAAAYAIGSEEAFGDTFDDTVKDMSNSASLARELSILYGQTDLGVFGTAGAASSPQDFDLTVASSCMGLWAQMEGAAVDLYDTLLTTKRNSTGDILIASVTLIESGATNGAVRLNLTGATADLDAVIIGDKIVPKGFVSTAVMAGVDKIITNTGSLFGISATTYPLWRANTYSCGSAELTMLKLTKASGRVVVRAGMMPLSALISVSTWTDLNNNHAALRRFAESTKTGLDLGTSKIRYYGPNGTIEIEPHAHVKNGEAFVSDWSIWKRIGASDLTFELPGSSPGNESFFQELANSAGYEVRVYWSQAIICPRPTAAIKLTDIVNSV